MRSGVAPVRTGPPGIVSNSRAYATVGNQRRLIPTQQRRTGFGRTDLGLTICDTTAAVHLGPRAVLDPSVGEQVTEFSPNVRAGLDSRHPRV